MEKDNICKVNNNDNKQYFLAQYCKSTILHLKKKFLGNDTVFLQGRQCFKLLMVNHLILTTTLRLVLLSSHFTDQKL